MKLVVTHAFGEYAIGQEITEKAAVEKALADHPDKVVRTADAPKTLAKE